MSVFLASSIFSIFTIGGFVSAEGTNPDQSKVFVMYAGSLAKTFEGSLGPSFQNQTGYTHVGEGKGSVQVTNLILEEFRKPDILLVLAQFPL